MSTTMARSSKYEQLIGHRRGQLLVTGVQQHPDKPRLKQLVCQCDCGKFSYRLPWNLTDRSICDHGADRRRPSGKDEAYYREFIKARISIDASGCWLWRLFVRPPPNSYGEAYAFGHTWRVHRLAYFLWKGPLDPALDICHSCDVKHCCNPAHLWQGTPKSNMQDAAAKKIWSRQHQTHCKRGHEFTPENTARFPSNPNRRRCKQCQIERMRSPQYRAKALERQRARRLHGQLGEQR